MLSPVSPRADAAEAEGATCIIQVLSHHYQRAVHGTSISRSVSRTFLCPGEPFPMYQSISSVAVLDPPFSSIRCSFTHSFALRSFVCSLLAHCAKVHSGKRTKVSQRRGEKKGGKGGSPRTGEEEEGENECVPYWHSLNPLSFKRIG